jgi:hypothetical protein
MSEPKTLGWREWVSFPDLGTPKIKAKVDTGARTSALHAFSVEPFERDSKQWVRFSIHPVQGDTDTVVACEAPVKDMRRVRDSGGHEELRYVIETSIDIGGSRVCSEVTLTDRQSMKFRVLLGRRALRKRFLVNPGKSYLCGKPGRN